MPLTMSEMQQIENALEDKKLLFKIGDSQTPCGDVILVDQVMNIIRNYEENV